MAHHAVKRIEAKEIHLTRRYQSGGATIKTYPGEIHQVFSTLLLNAMEAIDGAEPLLSALAKHLTGKIPRSGVRVTISDNE